ncbi:hypothetical protein NC651_006843 [Populus alba x Populus x berolinensis]|nr:hypothetical protein NC651_006843 [Populus alba x Populus x berolinensis]
MVGSGNKRKKLLVRNASDVICFESERI